MASNHELARVRQMTIASANTNDMPASSASHRDVVVFVQELLRQSDLRVADARPAVLGADEVVEDDRQPDLRWQGSAENECADRDQ